MWRILLIAVLLIVLVLGASIGYFNAQTVSFDYLFGAWELPLIALLIAAFALGVVLTLVVVGGRVLSLRLELRRARGRIRDHEVELRNLRNLPLTGESRSEAGGPPGG